MSEATNSRSYGWIDSIAIGMSVLCAVHCLLTPVLAVFLPIIATSFWVSDNFHLWMILFVVPSTGVAIFMGCRKHKDKIVLALSLLGISVLIVVAIYESISHSVHEGCTSCSSGLSPVVVVNVLAGILLASAHVRNYILCRHQSCDHKH